MTGFCRLSGSSICHFTSIRPTLPTSGIRVGSSGRFCDSWLIAVPVLVALSTNFIGYGLAGLTRRFLVYPSQAVWPANLATIALNRAFHADSNNVANGWSVSRMKWFMYCFTAMFIYFWFPNYILQAMSYFNWITWIAPDNFKLAAIAGSVTGLGLNPLPTFDWNQLVVIADPLINPFFVRTFSSSRDYTHAHIHSQ